MKQRRLLGFMAIIMFTVALLSARPLNAQVAVGTMLGEDAAGYPHALVIMDNGDIYRSDLGQHTTSSFPQLPWVRGCNLFTAGGPPARVVGVGGGLVLTSAGGTYRIGFAAGLPCYAIFDGVIDQSTSQSFVAIGANMSVNGCFIYAVTDAGHVYRAWVGCGPSGWEDAGVLPTGAVPTGGNSWGALKSQR